MYAAGVLGGKVYDNANPREFSGRVRNSDAFNKTVSILWIDSTLAIL